MDCTKPLDRSKKNSSDLNLIKTILALGFSRGDKINDQEMALAKIN